MAARETRVTTDHEFIRDWVERRGGCPAGSTRGRRAGVVRIEYPRAGHGARVALDWDAFFDWFEREGLAFEYGEGRARLIDRARALAEARARPQAKSSRSRGASHRARS
jgi:hypothetical protein